jgi:hypothetical protein
MDGSYFLRPPSPRRRIIHHSRAASNEIRAVSGKIFSKAEYGSVAVRRAIMDYLSQNGGLQQRIGFPVQEEDR